MSGCRGGGASVSGSKARCCLIVLSMLGLHAGRFASGVVRSFISAVISDKVLSYYLGCAGSYTLAEMGNPLDIFPQH